jgi:hypothetical protein
MEKKKFGHVMVDLETMGGDSGAAIVAIGAVEFNMHTGETGEEFYTNVDLGTCLKAGLKVNGDTIMWWLKQSDEARKSLEPNRVSLQVALIAFATFIYKCGSDKCEVWGNGARFDLGILSDAYIAIDSCIPWDFRKERDVRTIVSLAPEIKSLCKHIPFSVAHNAKDDCYHQIKYCFETLNHIKSVR